MSKRKQNFISMIETIIAKILPFGFVLWPLAMFIICTWLVISYDWPTFLTSFVCLILVIPGLIGLPKLIENLNNRLAKKNRWVFPTYGLDTFYEENPNKCVDDGICHILERENISRGYWGKYRNNAAIKEMVDNIRKPIYEDWAKAKAAKERARLAEKMKNWEQEAAKYTRYANLKGKEKSIQYCKDRITYYNKVLGNYSPDNMYKAQYEMAELSNNVYKASAQREHDWAVHGGIAQGIAGPAAGVATALNIQRENEQIRAQNAALGKRIGDMNVAYMQALQEQKTRLSDCRWKWEKNLKKAQEATIKQEDQKKLLEILAPKLESIWPDNDIHTMKLEIGFDREHIDVLKEMGYKWPHVDGSIKMTVKYNGKVIATPICVLPFDGSESCWASAVCKIPSNVTITYDDKKNVTAEFEPRDLWVVHNVVYYTLVGDEQQYE